MLRIISISDTHSLHEAMHSLDDYIDDSKINILIHGGDCTKRGWEFETKQFLFWFKNLKGFQKKFLIAGNHDFCFESKPFWLKDELKDFNEHNCVYLEDRNYSLSLPIFTKNLNIYGSPWQPRFYDWAFNCDRDKIHKYWDKIPSDTDVLITHGPPLNVRDLTPTNDAVGCESLRNKINEIKPLLHIFGHIHHSYGKAYVNETLFVNASICNEQYNPINEPIIVDINQVNGKFEIINL